MANRRPRSHVTRGRRRLICDAATARSPLCDRSRLRRGPRPTRPKERTWRAASNRTDTAQTKERLEQALFEIRRVIAGQDQMLERVLVCLLTGGHLLIEGVPGLAKTLTVKTTADVLGGTFNRIQFTPDLVPSDLVGTRIYRADNATFDTELGPVFCNFLLADEINRAPGQGAVGAARGDAGAPGHARPHHASRARPVPRDGDAEPDRVGGHLPAARGAGRPLHAQDPRRLPAPRRGADGDPALARGPARADAAALDRRPPRASRRRCARSTSIPASSATRSSSPPRRAARTSSGCPTWRASSRSAPARAARSA